MEKTNLILTIDEINKILGALGQQPYVHVFELINTIQQQVTDQLKGKG
ncbi:MAG: hypothetical protein Q8941_10135 [Bacteroidota bacterium]|nr:hypothetical protein [Bacteroidota bacterium]